ncbi:prophage tail fiber N-terminal domain-containing protein [Escherichia coli]
MAAVKISGVLRDGTGKPVPGCIIELKAKRTSETVIATTVAYGMPEDTGSYSMDVEPGIYRVTLNTEGYCVFRSIRSRIGIEVRSAIRIHSINRELNFFYRFLTRFFAAFHYRGIFPQ